MGIQSDRSLSKIKRQKRKQKIGIYKILFGVVIVWFLGNGIFNMLLGCFVNTQVVELTVIDKKYLTKGYIIRDEILINAPATGRIQNPIQAGERIGKNMVICSIDTSEGTALEAGKPVLVTAPEAGVVSYITDGLEEIFRLNELQTLDMEKIEKLKAEVVDNTKKNVVEKGSRFCKIINNLQGSQIYLEFPLNLFKEPIQKYKNLDLRFPQLDREISVPVVDLKGVGNTAQVLVQLPETWSGLLNVRSQPLEIILERREGILIPKKALVMKEKQGAGVFWLRKGFVFWQSVKVISEKGDQVVVDGLEPLTEIILNPDLVKEGQHLY